jgi:PEP-CTERM motif
MKKSSLLIPLTVAAVAVTSSVQAAYTSGDLLVGFTDKGGAANDFIFDVGPLSSLTSGETWTLGADVAGTFTSAQFASADWGVIGALTSTKTIYSSEGSAGVPTEIPNGFNTIRANVATVGGSSVSGAGVSVAYSMPSSWLTMTDQQTGTPGNYFFNNLDNPNQNTSATLNVYANDNLSDPATLDGYFNISANGNTLTFTAIPEPATWSLLAGFGLLAAGVRRRFVAKA